jgi:hypothetical protein
MVSQLSDGQPFGTHGPMADGRCRISFYLNHLSIFDMGDHTAAAMAIAASGPNPFYLIHCYLLFSASKEARTIGKLPRPEGRGNLAFSGHLT